MFHAQINNARLIRNIEINFYYKHCTRKYCLGLFDGRCVVGYEGNVKRRLCAMNVYSGKSIIKIAVKYGLTPIVRIDQITQVVILA